MDNQDNKPNWRNQICYIFACIVCVAFWLLDCLLPWLSFLLREVYYTLTSSSSVKVLTLKIGETFQAHETFIQKLKLQIEQQSAEKCDVILLFCPVVSRIGTDMEAAMKGVPEDKPVILVFMHHCHDPSHITDITGQPSRGNIVKTVHCAFHELQGLLECERNKQGVKEVRSTLQRYKQTGRHCPGEERKKINSVCPFSYGQL